MTNMLCQPSGGSYLDTYIPPDARVQDEREAPEAFDDEAGTSNDSEASTHEDNDTELDGSRSTEENTAESSESDELGCIIRCQ